MRTELLVVLILLSGPVAMLTVMWVAWRVGKMADKVIREIRRMES